jgi:hypothetical protein
MAAMIATALRANETFSPLLDPSLDFAPKIYDISWLLMNQTMRILTISAVLLTVLATASFAEPGTKPINREVRVKNFKGKVMLREIGDDKIEVRLRTWRTTRDTVRGHGLFPVLVNGHKQPFYFGKFGSSKLPVLVFGVSDPERISEAKALAYQVSPNGALIGQQVINDESIAHGHTDNVTIGRYAVAAIDPALGAIYSIAYQEARFEGYYVSYEKLRVRQWDPAINSFIETDQGFLRDRNGKLVEASRFHSWPDNQREAIFAANLEPVKPWMVPKEPKAIPARAAK